MGGTIVTMRTAFVILLVCTATLISAQKHGGHGGHGENGSAGGKGSHGHGRPIPAQMRTALDTCKADADRVCSTSTGTRAILKCLVLKSVVGQTSTQCMTALMNALRAAKAGHASQAGASGAQSGASRTKVKVTQLKK